MRALPTRRRVIPTTLMAFGAVLVVLGSFGFTPLTSADVVFTANYCMDPKGGCAQLAKFEQNMDKAARIAERSADASSAAWANAGKKVAALGGGVAGCIMSSSPPLPPLLSLLVAASPQPVRASRPMAQRSPGVLRIASTSRVIRCPPSSHERVRQC